MLHEKVTTIILAAGNGSRMRSPLAKVLHKIAGKEMIQYIFETVSILGASQHICVLSPRQDQVESYIQKQALVIDIAIQTEPKGTADAVKSALPYLDMQNEYAIILYGDTPFINPHSFEQMVTTLAAEKNTKAVVLGFHPDDPNGYGRLVTNDQGTLKAIVECKDANEEQKTIQLCNSGVIAIEMESLKQFLGQIDNNNAKGEFYLTDIIGLLVQDGYNVNYTVADPKEVMGINSKEQLAEAECYIQKILRKSALDQGVTLIDPPSIFLSADTQFGQDVTLHPHVIIGEGVSIEDHVEIKPFSHLEGAILKERSIIGPFARIRPASEIGPDAKIGNFVEIKKSIIASGAKVNHLSYIGDTSIGSASNIGAGTITCNYDGYAKHPTTIGNNCFIGSHTTFIAPISVGDGAIIGAGSVITEDVAKDSLVLARANQQHYPQKAISYRKKRNEDDFATEQ